MEGVPVFVTRVHSASLSSHVPSLPLLSLPSSPLSLYLPPIPSPPSPTPINLYSNFSLLAKEKKKRKIKTMNTTSTSTASSSSSSEQCESGWTLYLDHSTQFHNNGAKSHHHRPEKIPCCDVHGEIYCDEDEEEEEEEEDLSMVSDASSGPPHFEEAEDIYCGGGGTRRKRATSSEISGNVKLGRRRFEGEDFALDDTASSHPMMNVIFSSKKNGGVHCVENQASPITSFIDYSSQGFSATHFQVVVDSRKRR